MDIGVISLINNISNNKYGLKEKNIYLDKIKNIQYYKMENKSIKVISLTDIAFLKYKCNIERIIILIDEINELNEEVIYEFSYNKEIIVITGKYNGNKLLNNVIIMDDIIKHTNIDLELLLFFLAKDDIFRFIRKINGMIIVGKSNEDNIVSNIVISILKQLNSIEKCKSIEVYIYGEKELSLKVLSYIEDPIKEYLYNSKLIIKQIKSVNANNFINYLLICQN